MNVMNHGLEYVASCSVLAFACLASACSGSPTPHDEPTTVNPAVSPAPSPAPVRRSEVVNLRTNDAFVSTDYVASETAYKLFGIEEGDGQTPRSAILAEAPGWSTRAYHEGDSLGRGLHVSQIGHDRVTLRGPSFDVVIESGASTPLRLVKHRLDVVAKPLGKHRYAVDTEAARAAPSTLPEAESAQLYGRTLLKLGAIEAGSLFAEADLREGDLLEGVDGAPANDDALPGLGRALTDGRPTFALRVYRGGAMMNRTFVRAK